MCIAALSSDRIVSYKQNLDEPFTVAKHDIEFAEITAARYIYCHKSVCRKKIKKRDETFVT